MYFNQNNNSSGVDSIKVWRSLGNKILFDIKKLLDKIILFNYSLG